MWFWLQPSTCIVSSWVAKLHCWLYKLGAVSPINRMRVCPPPHTTLRGNIHRTGEVIATRTWLSWQKLISSTYRILCLFFLAPSSARLSCLRESSKAPVAASALATARILLYVGFFFFLSCHCCCQQKGVVIPQRPIWEFVRITVIQRNNPMVWGKRRLWGKVQGTQRGVVFLRQIIWPISMQGSQSMDSPWWAVDVVLPSCALWGTRHYT